MLEQINWEQINNNVFIKFSYWGKDITFKIDERIIIHLIGNSPKVYFLTISIGTNKQQYLVDFSHLKPIIKSSGKLSVKFKTTEKVEGTKSFDFGKYTIARGESFYERYLGVEGWQPQEYFFNLVPLEQKDIEAKITKKIETPVEKTPITTKIVENTTVVENIQNNQVETQEITQKTTEVTSKFKECPNCGNIVLSDFDYCPHCLTSFLKPEKDVDFAI